MRVAYLMCSNVSFQQSVFLLQVLNTGQVFPVVIRSKVAFHFIEPQFNVLHIAVELLLLVGFTQLNA